MSSSPKIILELINAFSRLPGVGKKAAQRYAYAVIDMEKEEADNLADLIVKTKENVKFCSICGNITDQDPCEICARREHNIIVVVEEFKDVLAMERLRDFKGVYHILHGTISPLKGKGPNDLNIRSLITRITKGGVEEIILATNPTVEGEATAAYLARLLKDLGVKVTRLAQGISQGSELEYTDENTLLKAIENRKEI